jgi:phosphate transport system substrate-binding protein
MNKLIAIVSLVLLLGQNAVASTTVSISGSTSLMPLAEIWAETFNNKQTEYSVMVSSGGSGAGIQNVANGLSDLGMTSRAIKESEKSKYGDNFIEHIVAKDCICLVVSKAVYDSGVQDLSQDQIKKIFGGEITNWNAVGGQDNDIFAVGREVGSGTRDFFNEHFFGDAKVETEGVAAYEGSNSGVVTAVSKSDKGIGYVSLGYINADGINPVKVDGALPSMKSAISGEYPVVRDLYMYSFKTTSPGAQAFLNFALSPEGQEIAKAEGYPPVA